MEFAVTYEQAAAATTVALRCDPTLRDAEQAASRLHGWGMIRGVHPAGAPFLRLTSGMSAFCHLPIETAVSPHDETGIALDRVEAGPVIALEGVRFGEARALARTLQYELGSECKVRGPAEFHSVQDGFVSGKLVLPVDRHPASRRRFIRLLGEEPADEPSSWESHPVRVVTIARQAGSGGEQVARLIARTLGFRFIDHEVFREAAAEAGVSVEAIASSEKRRGLLSRMLESFAWTMPDHSATWIPPVSLRTAPFYTSADYRGFVEDAIRQIASAGEVVIVGHGAQFTLADRPDTLRVFVAGSDEQRAARAMAQGLSHEEALKTVREADEDRVAFFREFHEAGWLSPSTYDLCLNTDRMPLEEAAATICAIARQRADSRPSKA